MKKEEFITIRITKDTKKKLIKISEKEDRTISYIVNKIIENHLKKDPT